MAKRLLAGIRQVDTVARIGGDEFIALIDGVPDEDMLARIGDSLMGDLRGNAFVDGQKVELKASLGSALFPLEGEDLDQLLKAADQEMYAQKQRGKVYHLNPRRP